VIGFCGTSCIIGVVIGAFVLLMLLIVVIICLIRCTRNRDSRVRGRIFYSFFEKLISFFFRIQCTFTRRRKNCIWSLWKLIGGGYSIYFQKEGFLL
jgi:hypothetical protein